MTMFDTLDGRMSNRPRLISPAELATVCQMMLMAGCAPCVWTSKATCPVAGSPPCTRRLTILRTNPFRRLECCH